MNILALDTSSKAASCAVLQDGRLAGEFFIHTALTHSQTILPMVQALLHSIGAAVGDMDVFAVSTGPGSFTGLRIGIASVKGMAMARAAHPADRLCAPVSTLEGLARNLAAFSGVVVPVMDARRAQVYTAAFRCGDGAVTRLAEDTALAVEDLKARLAGETAPVLLVGDGARMCGAAMADLPHVAVAPEALLHQRAGSVAAVAARLAAADKLVTAGDLSPAYLRLPQAERERLARLQRRPDRPDAPADRPAQPN